MGVKCHTLGTDNQQMVLLISSSSPRQSIYFHATTRSTSNYLFQKGFEINSWVCREQFACVLVYTPEQPF